MEQIAAPQSSSTASSFAGLLASLAAPQKPSEPSWSDDQLADDVATLSYEHALQARARYRSQFPAPALDSASSSGPSSTQPAAKASLLPETLRAEPAPRAPRDRTLKRASITIRLSEAESAQLHQRAAEAGLTVSAYLRSCTLEVESLRAQVKDTLAQLRDSTPSPPVPASGRTKAIQWRQLWPFGRRR
jgi:hypothetical protein